MKRTLATLGISLAMAVGMPIMAHADPVPHLPSCALYGSTAQVPVSFSCEPYYYNGTLVFDAIAVNQP